MRNSYTRADGVTSAALAEHAGGVDRRHILGMKPAFDA
jgi:hypothetical protein